MLNSSYIQRLLPFMLLISISEKYLLLDVGIDLGTNKISLKLA